jgi:hypothetical protein
MTTVLSPHWKDLVTLLKMLIIAPILIAGSALPESAREPNSEHDAIPVKPHAEFSGMTQLRSVLHTPQSKKRLS